jgi:uncharacterized protein YndB with AHSA1/START domain
MALDIRVAEFVEDFRIDGTAVNNDRGTGGFMSEFRATYPDIVEHERIVYAYDMWLDRAHASTSTMLEPSTAGTM